MAKKKYYGVKKGKVTGIFTDWDSCKAAVDGYPGAEYKGFITLEEAGDYLGLSREELSVFAGGEVTSGAAADAEMSDVGKKEVPGHGTVLAYVDGSYEDSIKKYAFGCVFILPDDRIYTSFGNGDNEQSLQHRNVTGEMLGAMHAVRCAIFNGYSEIELRYDYEGLEKWVTGAWRSKTELTGKYASYMRECMKSISLKFTKVPAHSNVKYNELADSLAKQGLVEGQGVPKVCRFEEMDLYHE